MMAGLSVATTQDLNAALSQHDTNFAEHKKWTENALADVVMKLRANTERLDNSERDQQTCLENIYADIKGLRAGTVTNQTFRQQINAFEQRLGEHQQDNEATVEQMKVFFEKEIATSVGNLRLKAETLNANCIALTEKSRVLEETLIPSLKSDLEEQKQRRICETQRLECETEKMKDLCEQKISHTAAALRFYVTATATKLHEELAPLTLVKELEEDLKRKELDLKKLVKSNEDAIVGLKQEVLTFKGDVDSTHDRHGADISSHTKALKVTEITMTNLQNSVASDLKDMREQMRTDRVNLQTEMADARAAAARAAVNNDSAIQGLASEVNPLRQFREVIMERLHIEKIVQQVREWQTGHVPQVTAALKDVEERVRKSLTSQSKDHDAIQLLMKSVSEVRGHFKMFHAIAAGLDDKAQLPTASLSNNGNQQQPEDSRLPPIQLNSARGGGGRSPP